MTGPKLSVAVERWPIAGSFTISRGSRTEAVVVVATITDGVHAGRGECVPYARYGETVDGVVAAITAMAPAIAAGAGRSVIADGMSPGAARNAIDCALWDLEAKRAGKRVWELAGLAAPTPVVTAYTLSLGTPETMHEAALAASDRPVLKVKLGGLGDPARLAAVRRGAPKALIIADANEAWTPEILDDCLAACRDTGVSLVEQPLPANADAALDDRDRSIPICADESLHDRHHLAEVLKRYEVINIKLDKTGGLTEAIALARAAKAAGAGIMVGCMVGTSLAMAPAMCLTPGAAFVDLDGPLLLRTDRDPGLSFAGSQVSPPAAALWG